MPAFGLHIQLVVNRSMSDLKFRQMASGDEVGLKTETYHFQFPIQTSNLAFTQPGCSLDKRRPGAFEAMCLTCWQGRINRKFADVALLDAEQSERCRICRLNAVRIIRYNHRLCRFRQQFRQVALLLAECFLQSQVSRLYAASKSNQGCADGVQMRGELV
jgi:hypothetical protein